MEKRVYDVKEASKKLELHEKTLLRFLKEGRIKGKKVGRKWTITEDEIDKFLGIAETDMEVSGSIDNRNSPRKANVSSVVDIPVDSREEAMRISNTLVAVLNSKDRSYGSSSYKFLYYEKDKTARFILNGSPQFMSRIMSAFELFID